MNIEIIYWLIVVWVLIALVGIIKILSLKTPTENNGMYLEKIGYELDLYEEGALYFVNKKKYVELRLNEMNDIEVSTNDISLDTSKVLKDYHQYKLYMELEKGR